MTLPRSEYPRPQFERKEWISLNGEWSFALDDAKNGVGKKWMEAKSFPEKIIVPFCPESKLSGVGYTDFINALWYHRDLDIPAGWEGKKILLHFGGVDYLTTVYIDGKEVGRHTGGASAFVFDIASFVKPGETHDLIVYVQDAPRSGLQPLGKQSPYQESCGCSYTRTTGIWQSVWLEAVSPFGLESCRVVPDVDNGSFSFQPVFYGSRRDLFFTVTLKTQEGISGEKTLRASDSVSAVIELADPRLWEPGNPFLYEIVYTVSDSEGNVLDRVSSYAGLRKIHIEGGRCYLNNKPVFLRLVLDQGYYQDGLWTAPDDEALKRDILLAMESGFNGARLHQKIFDERFHYWADRLGYLTWAEFPDWGMSFWQHFGKTNPDYMHSFRDYFAEWSAVVKREINHPSIIAWTPFNETTQIYDTAEHMRFIADIYDLTRLLDPTRPVNDTSGYTHSKTDLWTVHTYQQDPEEFRKQIHTEPVFCLDSTLELPAWKGQPFIVDEYGGISYLPDNGTDVSGNAWGYNSDKLSAEETVARMTALTEVMVNSPLVAGYCYTQLTDIEQECNGIYNYDRSVKFDMKSVRKCFSMKPEWSFY